MEQEIKNIIEKHLPEQTAGVMKDFIAQAEKTEKDLADAKRSIITNDKVITEYQKKEDLYSFINVMQKDLDDRVEALNVREELITQRENNATVIESTIRMEMMTSNMENMKELVNKVFGHPSVSITRSVPIAEHPPVTDQNNITQYGNVSQHTESETKTEGKSDE